MGDPVLPQGPGLAPSVRGFLVNRTGTARRPFRRSGCASGFGRCLAAAVACIVVATGLMPRAQAADPAFQDFFFLVCANPTGVLAARCSETDGGLGNLSGDSESSLNPSQTLATPNSSIAAASARSEEMRKRAERAHAGDGEAVVDHGPFSLLFNARHSNQDRTRTVDIDRERGYEAAITSLELGLDYRAGDDTVIGGWLSWERSDLDFAREQPGNNFTPLNDAGSIEHQSLGFSAFASFQLTGRAYVDISGGFLALDYDLERRSVFQESNRVVPQTNVLTEADTEGTETWAAATWGYHAAVGAWTFGPYIGVTWAKTSVDGYAEKDVSVSGLALTVEKLEQTSLSGTAGFRIARAISRKSHVLIPQLRLEYVRELDPEELSSAVAFQLDANETRFRLEGDKPDKDYFNANVGIAGVFRNGWMSFFEFQSRLGHDDLDRYQIVAGLRVEL